MTSKEMNELIDIHMNYLFSRRNVHVIVELKTGASLQPVRIF